MMKVAKFFLFFSTVFCDEGKRAGRWKAEEETVLYWKELGKKQLLKNLGRMPNNKKAKNLIVFMGDGMGVQTVTAGRILKGQKRGENGESFVTAMESLDWTGLAKTYSVDVQTPDSASTANALFSGFKTTWSTAGVTAKVDFRQNCESFPEEEKSWQNEINEGKSDESVAESILVKAKKQGKKTALVTSTRLTHATPSAVYAHYSDRWHEKSGDDDFCPSIARQLVSNARFFDIIFGGGMKNIGPELDRLSSPHKLITTKEELMKLNKTESYLGIFADGHLPYKTDRDSESDPSLVEMTIAALKNFESHEDGYVMIVEGGRIDHGHHANQAHKALEEFVEFDDTIETVLKHVNLGKAFNIFFNFIFIEQSLTLQKDETLVIVTADHSHSFTITGYGARNSSVFGDATISMKYSEKYDPRYPGSFTKIQYAQSKAKEELKYNQPQEVTHDKDYLFPGSVSKRDVDHGADDVPVYASGPMSHLLVGTYEQSYIFTVMMFSLCLEEFESAPHCQ